MTFILPGGLGQVGAPSIPSAWNPLDKRPNAVLTVNNTVVSSSGGASGVRGVKSHTNPGLWYLAITVGFPAGTTSGCGLATAAASIASVNQVNQAGIIPDDSGPVYDMFNMTGNFLGAISVVPTNGDILGFAWNATAGNLFVSINGTYYNSSGSATGTTPSVATMTGVSGILFPWAVAIPGAGPLSYTLNTNPAGTPAGYTNWG